MKLLFDNNLSVKTAKSASKYFPGSKHVFELQIDHYSDSLIWNYAKENGYCIITKDKGFYHLSTTKGGPPKVIWILAGNCSNRKILQTIEFHKDEIAIFLKEGKDMLILNNDQ